jgi:hypothetical protein
MNALGSYFNVRGLRTGTDPRCFFLDIPQAQRKGHGGWADEGYTFYIGKRNIVEDLEDDDGKAGSKYDEKGKEKVTEDEDAEEDNVPSQASESEGEENNGALLQPSDGLSEAQHYNEEEELPAQHDDDDDQLAADCLAGLSLSGSDPGQLDDAGGAAEIDEPGQLADDVGGAAGDYCGRIGDSQNDGDDQGDDNNSDGDRGRKRKAPAPKLRKKAQRRPAKKARPSVQPSPTKKPATARRPARRTRAKASA